MLLEIGDGVRYSGIGAGKVIAHIEREFKNQNRLFAVIEFPHRSMSAQIPIGDPAVQRKLMPLLSKAALERSLRTIAKPERVLPRTWDQREEAGIALLRTGGPADWCMLLAAYAQAEAEGISVAASDAEIVESALELMAAELSAVGNIEYAQALEQVKNYYKRAATSSKKLVPIAKRSAVIH